MPRFSLSKLGVRTKFVLLLLVFGLAPAAVLYAVLVANDDGVKNLAVNRLGSAATEISQAVSTTLRERYGDVQAFAINATARDVSQWYTPAGRATIAATINEYVALYEVYPVSAIVDNFGRVVVANSIAGDGAPIADAVFAGLDFGGDAWFRDVVAGSAESAAFNGVYVGAPVAIPEVATLTGGTGLVIPFAAPITSLQGETIGYWVNLASFDLVDEIVATGIAGLHTEGFSLVHVTLRGPNGSVLLDTAHGAGGEAAAEITGTATIAMIDGTDERLDWTVQVTMPASAAFGAWNGIVKAMLIGIHALSFVVLCLGLALGSAWTRPIRKLKALMAHVETEPFDAPVPYLERGDELGSMARSLVVLRDGMRKAGEAEAERNAKELLETLVLERTRDLAETNGVLGERKAWLEGILSNLPVAVGLIEAPSGQVILANKQLVEVLGVAEFPANPRSLFSRFEPFRANGSVVDTGDLPTNRALRGEAVHGEEIELRRDDELPRIVSVNAAPIRSASGDVTAGVVVVEDITARRAASERIRHLAMHDSLTGLPNRATLFAHLDGALAAARDSGANVALLLVDLDEFKAVNDVRGQHVGDQLLIEAAQRLRGSLRSSDVVGRIGGDEFAIVAHDITDTASLAVRAERILRCFERQFNASAGSLAMRASVGVALSEHGGLAGEELFQRADLALQAAKNCGGGGHRFFVPDMRVRAIELAVADAELPQALRDGTLEVFYQPIIDISDLSVASVEALLRWRHPTRGLLAPAAFLHHAERNHQIVPITNFVIAESLAQLADWRRRGLSGFRIAVNLSSAAVIDDDLPDHLARRIVTEGLRASDVILEVTEGAINEFERSVAALRRFREMGLTIAIDDFGAGYSSLARLRDLPIDMIKFDRAFIDSDPRTSAILSAMIHLSSSLGIPAVVEGVELDEQVDMLRAANVKLAQGYYFARPMRAADFEQWLRRHQSARSQTPTARPRPKLAS